MKEIQVILRMSESEIKVIKSCALEDRRSVNSWCRIALAAQALEQAKKNRLEGKYDKV